MKINLGGSQNKRFLRMGDRNRQHALNILNSVNKIKEYDNQGNQDVISMAQHKNKKSYTRKYKQYGELMSINEISPSNYSAVGSFMGHPKTAASDYNKGIYRSES